ncbi:hypothetical protein GWI33_012764 [Rhynchophorus ferrugineus]|uniref:C2H2-type domain-containing protein n=1 Tax=Rhynchophorus ferrugineus TaxID=354439 RepID=A0A834MIH2_RHYFE|nr:hypothetical protein GWI33_012764 [Rhynchophorus ferrugineus]
MKIMAVGHQCSACGKVYKHKTHLSRHKKYECGKTATFFCGVSIFCNICGAVFKHLASLKYHIANNVCTKPKKDDDAKQLMCPACGKLFKGVTAMQYHVKRRVCQQVKVYSAPPYPCKWCGTMFNLKQSWYVHMKREACKKYPEKYGLKRENLPYENVEIELREMSLDIENQERKPGYFGSNDTDHNGASSVVATALETNVVPEATVTSEESNQPTSS